MTPQASTGKAPAATERVAAFTASTRIADIPPDVVHLGKKSILDSLATGLSGSVAPGSVLMRRYVETLGCSAGSCMVIGSALRLPPRFAALANGTAMHIDDFDDTWQSRPDGPRARHTARMGVHPSGPVLSAVLAAAEGEGRSGADVLAACLVGVEVCCAVFDATDAVEVDNALHTTSSCALVGAAAGVANLRGLGETDVRRMLGIACDQTGGLTAQAGTMAKSWHGGRAAEGAIIAADLTALGFTAEESVLEHPGGYFQFEGGGYDETPVQRLGDPWCFVDRGLWLKPFPTGSLGHPAMTKILELILEHDVMPDQVDKIRVRTRDGVLRTLAYHRPKRALEAKFSLEFCLATLLLERSLGLTHIDDAFVRRPEVQDLIGRTEYTPIPEAEARDGDYTLVTSFVEMALKDGRRLAGRIDYGKGSKANPMSDDEVAEKFRLCARYARWPDDKAEGIVELARRLEELPDVRQLTALLSRDS